MNLIKDSNRADRNCLYMLVGTFLVVYLKKDILRSFAKLNILHKSCFKNKFLK